MNSEVKQIASGRFGVTANYLIHAKIANQMLHKVLNQVRWSITR